MYFLDNRDNKIRYVNAGHDCYGSTSGGNAVYQRNGTHNLFWNNAFHKHSFHSTGLSNGTVLFNNTFDTGSFLDEDCYQPTGQCPYDTLLTPHCE